MSSSVVTTLVLLAASAHCASIVVESGGAIILNGAAGGGDTHGGCATLDDVRQIIREELAHLMPSPPAQPAPPLPPAATCLEILQARPGNTNGEYEIFVDGAAVSVYCDMTTDGGGWTLAAYAGDNSNEFYKMTSAQGVYAPLVRSGRATINAVPIARASTEVAFSVAASSMPTGGINSYEIATKMTLSDPASITLDPSISTGPCQLVAPTDLKGSSVLSGAYHWNTESLTMGPYGASYAYGTSHCTDAVGCGHTCTSWNAEHNWALCFQGSCSSSGQRMRWHYPNGDGIGPMGGAVAIWFR